MNPFDIPPLIESLLAEYNEDEWYGNPVTEERRAEIERLIEAAELQIEEKLDGVASWIETLKADAEFLASTTKRLQEKKAAIEHKIERAKRFAAYLTRGEKVKTRLFTFYFTNRPSVVVTDISLLPEELIRRSDPEPRKTEIAARLKAGEEIPGCYMEQGQPVLTIR